MQFDNKKVLSAILKQGILLNFAPNTFFGSKSWHYAVVVNNDPMGKSVVVVACITSKYPERLTRAQQLKLPLSTLVKLPLGAHPKFTSGTSGIDCNYAIKISLDDLVRYYDNKQVTLVRNNGELNTQYVNKIIQGIKDSTVVAANVQSILD